MKEKLKDRFNILAIAFVLIAIVMTVQLANLQIINGKKYDEESQKRLLRERRIIAPRGNVYDRNGIPLAVNKVGFTVRLSNTKLKRAQLDDLVLRLIQVLEKNNESYTNNLSKYLTLTPLDYGPSIKDNKKIKDRERWIKDMAVKKEDIEKMTSPREIFEYLRGESKFNIDPKYSDEDAYKIMTLRYEILINGYSSVNPLCVAKNIKRVTVAQLEERNYEFPGVTIETEPLRKYSDPVNTAHILGYVGTISAEEYQELKDEGYYMNDSLGKAGIEVAAEKYLRGIDGQKRIEVDLAGRLTQELNTNPPEPGKDVILTLDSNLQRVAMESLEANIKKIRSEKDEKHENFGDANVGAAVAMDVRTGEVLAMASYPSYDPSVYMAPAGDTEAQKIKEQLNAKDNEEKPLINRAINGIYAPGSTFKPITAIAGLEEGIIKPNDYYYDTGTYKLGNSVFKCLEYRLGYGPHRELNLTRALATSCNIYFYDLGLRVGSERMAKWARLFGLGQKTGIDIPGESRGIVSSKEYVKANYTGEFAKWYDGNTIQSAIGQSYHNYTPIQLVNYIATIANGGQKFKPYLIKKVVKYDGSIANETKPEYEQVPVKKETLEAVRAGLAEVVSGVEGTATTVFKDFPKSIQVAGKTGTAETYRVPGKEPHSSNALFVCYAPANDPKIAVAVVVERGAWGSNTAYVAKDIMEEYFGLNKKSKSDDQIKQTEGQLIP